MKAIVLSTYGPPALLQCKEVAKPIPKADEILIRVHATALNDYDWSMVRGKPLLYRLMFGLWRPRIRIPGMELAGVVEAIGPQATTFAVGDAVYGDISEYGFGTLAEYICISEKAVVPKPGQMSFEEATAIPHAGLLALQGLLDAGGIRDGQQILINGAGGGVGTFGLQLARSYDVEVTGVDTGAKLAMMRSIGFDHIIDYKKEDFTRNGKQYDLILDAKTNRSPRAYLRALTPAGVYVTVGGKLGRLLQLLLYRLTIGRFTRKQMHIVALKPNQGLDHIQELFAAGKLKCVIDGPFTLEEVPEALQYFGAGKHQGKVVISLTV